MRTVHSGGRESRKGALKRSEPVRWGQEGIRGGTSWECGLIWRNLGRRSHRRDRFQTGMAKDWLCSHLPLLRLFEMPSSLGIIPGNPGMNKNDPIMITDMNWV